MLSYQHIYHAGNIVDCQKHSLLSALFNEMNKDETPYCYIDTHSGRGLYDLGSKEAQKIQEYKTGIEKIWTQKWPQEMRSYKDVVTQLNSKELKVYPGSPYIAYSHLRPTDALELYEIHPQELTALDDAMGDFDNVGIYNLDGWQVLHDYLPPEHERGVVLIDPSYELKNEYHSLPKHVHTAVDHWPEGIFVIWYPILQAGRHIDMINTFQNSGINHILKSEIMTGQTDGLLGTGVLIINPPTGFKDTVEKISNWLTLSIGKETTTEWLVP
jgi:23S rRNA (adenine2030-N6)-methyltransferase